MNSTLASILKIALGAISSMVTLVIKIITNKIDDDSDDDTDVNS